MVVLNLVHYKEVDFFIHTNVITRKKLFIVMFPPGG